MDAAELQTMLDADDRHWWYRGRRRIVNGAIERIGPRSGARILDAGCGSGRTLDELSRWGVISGLDVAPASVAAARSRGHADVRLGPVEELPWPDDTFDLVTCLDVIEHTPDDLRTLSELRRVTRPGGHLVVTVPAGPRLWSDHDVASRHYRRYTHRSLRAASGAAGWHTLRDTSFNSILLGPIALVRWTGRLRSAQRRRSDLQLTPGALGALLELPLRAEAALLRRGVRLPAGVSILAVLRNPGPERTSREP
jgi:SAM-dependent methyltransferase